MQGELASTIKHRGFVLDVAVVDPYCLCFNPVDPSRSIFSVLCVSPLGGAAVCPPVARHQSS